MIKPGFQVKPGEHAAAEAAEAMGPFGHSFLEFPYQIPSTFNTLCMFVSSAKIFSPLQPNALANQQLSSLPKANGGMPGFGRPGVQRKADLGSLQPQSGVCSVKCVHHPPSLVP